MAPVSVTQPREPSPAATPRSTTPEPTPFRPDIQGLRALAVLAVVLYHAGVPFLSGGFVGVDVFFVLSGFLITGLLWRELEQTGRISLTDFYARRIRRLLPAAVLVLLVTLAAATVLLPPLRLAGLARDAAAAALYSANYRFALAGTDYLAGSAPPSPLQHFWSLGVEEQFYLVYPVLLVVAVAVRRRSTSFPSEAGPRLSRRAAAAGLAMVGSASLVLCAYLTGANQPWAFYSLPPRAWELAAGGLLALTVPQLRRLPPLAAALLGWAGAGLLAIAVIGYGATTTYPGTAALLPVVGTLALLAAGAADGSRARRLGPARLLRHGLAQRVGALSYSWYLWHWPVLILGSTFGTGPYTRAALVLLSAGLAALSLRFVENPVRWSVGLTRSPGRSLRAGAVCTAAALVVALVVAVGMPAPHGSGSVTVAPRLSTETGGGQTPDRPARNRLAAVEQPVISAAASSASMRSVPANLTPSLSRAHADKAAPFLDGCDLGFTASVSPACVYGDAPARTRIIAFGDSHAAQWQPGLDAAARQQHWRLENLTKATCPPMPLPLRSPVLGREFRECEQWRSTALARILAEKPQLVVIDVARHYGSEYGFVVGSPEWTDALANLVERLHGNGIAVLVLGATPKPPSDVPDCLSEHLDDLSACTAATATEVDPATAGREGSAVRSAGGSFVEVAPWICSPDRCDVVLDNLLIFRDDNHVTTGFARWLAPVLTAAVQSALPTGRA